MKLAVATPTYNEATNIKKLLPALKKHLKDRPGLKCTVFVIDDNSPDHTAEIAEKWNKKHGNKAFKVIVLRRKKKEGLGKAYVYGFREILSQKFDFILQMDADLSHDPRYLSDFMDASKDADFVVGSRYVKGGATPDWTWNRKLLSRGGNLYTRFFLGSRITDYTGGYNLYSESLLNKIDLDTLQSGGYGFLIELKYRAIKKAKAVRQVPIVFMDRAHGNSKMPKNLLFKNLLLVPKIKYNLLIK